MAEEVTMTPTGQTPEPTSGGVFLSGSLALDLLNTEMVWRARRIDVLSSPETLARWWAEARHQHPEGDIIKTQGQPVAWTPELLDAVIAFRKALRTVCSHMVETQSVAVEDLEPLNQVLALGYPSLERTAQGQVVSVMHLRDTQTGPVLLPIALSALRLLTGSDWQRLHKCKNDRCVLYFYDTTKSATRQWCSLGCMNRHRSIQHYRAAKRGAAPRTATAG
jgi:predicted RNA-binding Zn ribbon-like protein